MRLEPYPRTELDVQAHHLMRDAWYEREKLAHHWCGFTACCRRQAPELLKDQNFLRDLVSIRCSDADRDYTRGLLA